MKLVILDGYTLNPGDLSWKDFGEFGSLMVYDRTEPNEVVARAADADVVLTNKTVLSGELLAKLEKLKYIGVLATGVNVVDLAFTKKAGIVVTNVPNYTGLSAAQMVMALILELTNRVGHHSRTVIEGRWSESKDFCYWDFPLVELDGLALGIVGYGGIGKAVTRMALAFGMKVLVHSRTLPDNLLPTVQFCDLDTLFASSDVISLHCPLTQQTKEMINRESLSRMKKTSYIINISRGGLIVEEDLASFLNDKRIAGAGLDVLSLEPPNLSCPLLSAKNCIITPHIAWATLASRRRLMAIAVSNLKAYLAGSPVNTVN